MLVDLHAHYPMHVIPRGGTRSALQRGGTHAALREWPSERRRAQIINLVSKLLNYQGPGDTPGVTVERLREGDVGVVLSALLEPFDEVASYPSPPHAEYFQDLMNQLEGVESEVAEHPDARVIRTADELERCLEEGLLAVVHAVEGGFHLGAEPAAITANVATLDARGVAYVTLAHVIWRMVATNAPAIPWLPDRLYRRLLRQPADEGLSELGRAAVRAMASCRMLVDVTHMSEQSIADTFELMDEVNRGKSEGERIPVIATHMACRFGNLEYSLQDDVIERIAGTGGVLGVIDCRHYIASRRSGNAADATFSDSIGLICDHIDHIAGVTGSFEHIAIGSDLDGYIKPALTGLEHSGRMRGLQQALETRYGRERTEKICSGNALRVLYSRFGRSPRRARSTAPATPASPPGGPPSEAPPASPSPPRAPQPPRPSGPDPGAA